MKRNYYRILSAVFSILSFVVVVPVWGAGAHKYGSISDVWQAINLNLFMALGLAFVGTSTIFLIKSLKISGFSNNVAALPIVAFGVLQFAILSFLYVMKIALHG